MAEAMFGQSITADLRRECERDATRALDALLDTLDQHRDEYDQAADDAFMAAAHLKSEDIIGYGRGRARSHLLVLLSVLREET